MVYPDGEITRWADDFGGPEGDISPYNAQLYATRGYGILCPDARIRSGATAMQDMVSSEMAGVNEIIRRGYADPDNWSYGSQLWRIQCICHSGSNNSFPSGGGIVRDGRSVAFYLSLEEDGSADGIGQNESNPIGPHGTLWNNRQGYISNSPLYFFDRVSTPLLMIEGTRDHYQGATSARMAFTALRRLHKDVQLALYEGEHHGPTDWTYSNSLDVFERTITWFDRFLCPNRVSLAACVQ